MTPPAPPWFRRHWKSLIGLLLLLGTGAVLAGIFAWKRGTDANAKENHNGDSADSEPKQMLSQYSFFVNALSFSPDGRQLATAAVDMMRKTGKDRKSEIQIWDVASGREHRGCQDFSGLVTSLAFSPDGKTLAIGVGVETQEVGGRSKVSGEVKLWDLDSAAGPSLWQKADHAICSVAFSPQGQGFQGC